MYKRTLNLLPFFAFCMAVAVIGCKKTGAGMGEKKTQIQSTDDAPAALHARMPNSADLSRNGYLVFSDGDVLESYREYVVGHTHAEVQTYLASLGFSSYGASLYGREYYNQIVADDQAADYLLSSDLLVQIGKIIYRPTASPSCLTKKWDFVLAMDQSLLSPRSLAELQAGTYDQAYMNQFATNSDIDSDPDMSIDDYMARTPSGHLESVATDCPPTTSEMARPMFGHGPWINTTCTLEPASDWLDQNGDGIADPTYNRCRHRMTYVFWVGVGWDNDCYKASGCN